MKRKLTIAGIVIGVILALGPLWSVLGSVIGMNSALDELGGNGISDPHALSSKISAVLFFQTFGFIACPIGIALCIFCVLNLQAIRRTPPPVPPTPAQGTSEFKA